MIPVQTGLTYPWMEQASLRYVLDAFQTEKALLYFVGGCVRDSLLDKTIKDIDLTTPCTPNSIINILKKHSISYAEVGKAYGSIMAIVAGQSFEITSFRRDVETDGRRAQVSYTDSMVEDSERRDFTINALYLSFDGNLYDPQCGFNDITDKHLKFIGDPVKRIQEDYLRILRFFRFYTEFNKDLDQSALYACRAQAHNLSKISKERICQELMKLLAAPYPLQTLQLMIQAQLFVSLMNPELDIQSYEQLQNIEIIHKIQASPLLRLYVLFARNTQHLITYFPFSKQEKKFFIALRNDCFLNLPITYWLYYYNTDIAQAQIFLHAINKDNDNDFQQEWYRTLIWQRPVFSLNSQDIIQLGYDGADIGYTLKAVEKWWVQQEFQPSRTACLDYVINRAQQ